MDQTVKISATAKMEQHVIQSMEDVTVLMVGLELNAINVSFLHLRTS